MELKKIHIVAISNYEEGIINGMKQKSKERHEELIRI